MQNQGNGVSTAARETAENYREGEDRPLGGYLVVMALFASIVAGAAGLVALTGRRLPPGIGPWDVLLITAGTHKLSRTITKDSVTSPLRAPFTQYEGTSAPAVLAESVRGHGLRHSTGELLTCPFCSAQWIATAYAAGLVFAPDATRLTGMTMTAVAGSNWLQLAYARLQQSAKGPA